MTILAVLVEGAVAGLAAGATTIAITLALSALPRHRKPRPRAGTMPRAAQPGQGGGPTP